MEAQTGVPALSQSLSLGDVALADGGGGGGGSTLGAQGVASGGTVVLSLPPGEPVPARTGAVEVEVPPSLRPLYGASLVVAAPAAETVGELKARVAAVTGLSAAAQALAARFQTASRSAGCSRWARSRLHRSQILQENTVCV